MAHKPFDLLAEAKTAGAATIQITVIFINHNIIDFVIVAFAVFLLVKQLNRFAPKPAPAPVPVPTKDCGYCKTAIPVEATRCPKCTSQL